MPEASLTAEQRQRYARHLALAEIGPGGQRRLLRSSVLIVGVGALGSPAALYLAAAGSVSPTTTTSGFRPCSDR
jgi:molybdopterin/thiamine biosynthesis adenylyltransferase